jgi:hypothetical protein
MLLIYSAKKIPTPSSSKNTAFLTPTDVFGQLKSSMHTWVGVAAAYAARNDQDLLAFDCTSQEKAAHGHVVYAVQDVSKTASKGCPKRQLLSRK